MYFLNYNFYSQISNRAFVNLDHIGDELDALADDEEDHDQDQDPGHARLAPARFLASWLVLRRLFRSLKTNCSNILFISNF